MGIKLQRAGDSLVAVNEDQFGHRDRVDLSAFLVLTDYQNLVTPAIRSLIQKRPATRINGLRALSYIGHALNFHGYTTLPNPKDTPSWQFLVLKVYRHALTRADWKRKLAVRVKTWNAMVAPIFEHLRDVTELLPLSIEIPKIQGRLESLDTSAVSTQLIGDPAPEVEAEHYDKLLVSISLARTDAQYLDELRDALLFRRHLVRDCLLKWWCQIRDHYNYGQEQLRHVNWPELHKQLKALNKRKSFQVDGHHIALGDTPERLGNLLAILVHCHSSLVSREIIENSDFLPYRGNIKIAGQAPKSISKPVQKIQRLNWMLGNLSSIDIAVCTALLIMANPRLTPISLLRAKLRDKNGKPYLETSDSGKKFRIEKARAKAMKFGDLDETSREIVTMVAKMTDTHRRALRRRKSPLSDLLFLLADRGDVRLPHDAMVGAQLSGARALTMKDQHALYRHFPELPAAGFRLGEISHSRIRATEGVLEWFRTGSIHAMSKKLGNTEKTVLEHYLPPSLLASWNTRLVRRYQNLWLSVAASQETFLLEATDFQTLEDLHTFLADMLFHHRSTSSPLAKVLHQRLSETVLRQTFEETDVESKTLMVSVSPRNLTALYLYQSAALGAGISPVLLDLKDVQTGLSARQFLILAETLKHQLPGDRDSRMREAHEAAVAMATTLEGNVQWKDLFVEACAYAST